MTTSTSEPSMPNRTRTPVLGIVFWAIMLLTVTAGRTVSDAINGKLGLNPSGTLLVACALMLGAFVLLSLKRYVPWSYWATVAVCSMLGNALADYLVMPVEVSSLSASAIFAVVLIAVLALWFKLELLSVQAIVSARQETFYWLAVVFTLAFGTSFGDVVADKLGLGDRATALLFAAAVCVIVFAYLRLGLKVVPAFWLGFIFMQPVSNSLGDLISQPAGNGGLGAGAVVSSALLLVLVVSLILYEVKGRPGNRFG